MRLDLCTAGIILKNMVNNSHNTSMVDNDLGSSIAGGSAKQKGGLTLVSGLSLPKKTLCCRSKVTLFFLGFVILVVALEV